MSKSVESSRRRFLINAGLLAAGATGLVVAGTQVDWEAASETPATPELTWQEERKQRNAQIEQEARDMLVEKGVGGEIPLVDLKDISHLVLSGEFVLGSGEISEERIETYNFSWTPAVDNAYTIVSELPKRMFDDNFRIVDPSPENPDPQASIRFDFDIDKFIKKKPHVSPTKYTGIKDYGDDPAAYITSDLITSVTVSLTTEQYYTMRESGYISFPNPQATPGV